MGELLTQFVNFHIDVLDRSIDNLVLIGRQAWSLQVSGPLWVLNCLLYGLVVAVQAFEDLADRFEFGLLVVVVHTALVPLSMCSVMIAIFLTVSLTLFGPKLEPVTSQPKILTDPKYGIHKYAEIQGITLHYVEKNGKDPVQDVKKPNENAEPKPIILFLHGYSEFWFTWRHQIEEFSQQNYRTVAVDLRGFGDSDKPAATSSYNLDVLVQDLKNFIEHINPKQQDKLYVVARGWGAVILYIFLLEHQDLVNAYVTQNVVPPYTFKLTFRQILNSWKIYLFRVPFIAKLFIAAYLPRYLKKTYGNLDDQEKDEVIEVYTYLLTKSGAYTYPLKYFEANVIPLVEYNLYGYRDKFVSSSAPPGLCMYAEDDQTLDDSSFKFVQFVPNLQTVKILQVGYKMTELKPKLINKMIKIFISHLRPKDGKLDDVKSSLKSGKVPAIQNHV